MAKRGRICKGWGQEAQGAHWFRLEEKKAREAKRLNDQLKREKKEGDHDSQADTDRA